MQTASTLPLKDQQRNILRLATAQALAGANSVVFYATGAIVGNAIAPNASLATFPITMFVLGMAACILPFGVLARKYGRKAAFMAGTGAGMVTGLAAALAVVIGSFALFCLAAFLGGAYAAVALSFRFAATDGVDKARRARALSLVMGGGVAAGVIGPMLVTGTMDLWPPHTFAITYVAQALVAALSAWVLTGVKTTEPVAAAKSGGRPLREIVRQPGFLRTVFSGAVTYMIMNFLMTAAPLSMHMHGISQQAANLGIQWHVIAMFGPGFFTGRLINRFGAMPVAAAGLLMTGLSVVVGLSGTEIAHYWLSLILLGIGWNFGFTGASTKIIDFHRPEEKTQVQSLNDFVVFGVMIVGSFSSGALLNLFGWNAVLWGSLFPVALALLTLLPGRQKAVARE
ncbi:multidrug efflux system protein MdtL [Serratia rubidaea]|uniref:Multidrug efflux system protein MdtL n=1 Tax=Serratia rubidaea TaxID=61652 RepID=A0A4U9HPU4_SERRU|nr:MFS transporter [Serratia rubidaea]QPR63831.1 MFS transporter [Serratia rubidaea]CAI1050768.1 multidrug efflux system protein MdtL [Serratia rubidaea]CAI1816287.1 multidrug efflux system protein MdtL [Serratia rubidaea]VTP65825.1 multidrug efflux system protein MdtL [Serratia rubidaea]HAY0637988.1 MFS transporter [Serratia rubidaea]